MTGSNGREVEQSGSGPARQGFGHVNHEKGEIIWIRFIRGSNISLVLAVAVKWTPAPGPIADPLCGGPPRFSAEQTCLQTGRQHSNSLLDVL